MKEKRQSPLPLKLQLWFVSLIVSFVIFLCFIIVTLLFRDSIIASIVPEAQSLSTRHGAALQPVLAKHLFFALFAAIGIVLLLFNALSFLILELATRHIPPVHEAIRKVMGGDYSVKIPCGGVSQIATLLDDFNFMVRSIRKKIAFQKYVSRSTAEMIERLKTGEFTTTPQRLEVTPFFSDVRGFTSYSEDNDPLVVVDTINKIFDIQVSVIHRNGGDIDKFMGDEIMAIFPNPEMAFQAALEIQKKMKEFNKKEKNKLSIGIGISHGYAVTGAIGSGNSYDWTTIGDVVNIANRLCAMAGKGSIYVSMAAFKKIESKRPYKIEEFQIRGLKKKLQVVVYK